MAAALLRWRDERTWGAYLVFLAVFLTVFVPVYTGAGYLNSLMPARALRLHLSWEPSLPLVAWMAWVYVSLYTTYALPLVHLDVESMRRLTVQSVAAVLVAGVVFIAMPVTSGFVPASPGADDGLLVSLIGQVDTPFNLVPSLHVTCAALILLACAERVAWPWLRAFYFAWLAVLSVSTLLVHQHHVIDVLTGLALAVAARRVFAFSGVAARP